MKVYHQTGFRQNWNIESFQQGVGDGLIYSPINLDADKLLHLDNSIKQTGFLDPQLYLLNEAKGTIDIHLSKPISRATLILGRAFGGVIAVGSNVLFFTLGIFVLYGIFSGVWHLPFLLWTISISMFGFCIVYSFILFLNVVTESWILPMSLAYIHVIILSAFLFAREATLFMIIKNPIFQGLINGWY